MSEYRKDRGLRLGEYFLVSAVYLGIIMYLTYPLILNINKVVISSTGEMAYWQAWFFWWFKYALTELHQNPFITDYQFYPNGSNILTSGATFIVAILSLPIQFFVSPTTNLNIFYLLSYPFTGLGMYILLRDLTGCKLASFIGGIIFAFNPIMIYQGTMNQLHCQIYAGVPLYILFFIRMLKEGDKKAAVWAGLWTTFNAMNNLYSMVFCLIFSLVYWLYFIGIVNWRKGVSKEYLKLYGLLIGTFLITNSLMIFNVLREIILHGDYTSVSIWIHGGAISQSADLLGFFLPSFQNPFLGSILKSVMAGNKSLYVVYLGYTAVGLSAFIALKKWKEREIRFWIYTAVFFFVLALGPILHINGRETFNIFGSDYYLYLPGYLTYYLPLLKGIRGPISYGMMVYLSLSILTGYALAQLFVGSQEKPPSIASRRNRIIATAAIFSLIMFEYMGYPGPFQVMETPKVYEIIGKDKEASTLLELPFGVTDSVTRLMWADPNPGKLLHYQITHKKKVFHGIQGRIPKENLDFYLTTPVIRSMFYINQIVYSDMPKEQQKYEVEQLIKFDKDVGMKVLREYNVKYITLYPPFSFTGSIAEEYITKVFNVEKIATIDGITLYGVQ